MEWIKKRKNNSYLIYTFLFTTIMGMVCMGLFLSHKSFMWDKDGLFQHYTALAYFGRWGREILKNIFVLHTFQVPLWDFHIGYGSDVITTFHYYVIGDPLNLFSIFVPFRYTEYLYQALVVLRMYLAGLSFIFYCKVMHKGKAAVLAGALTYVFCGYMLNSALHHPFFLNPMIYLPLLMAGVEYIFCQKKPFLFITMVFVSAVSNFYFFYMLAAAVCFYVCVRFFTVSHERMLKELFLTIGAFFGYACVGVFLSAAIFLPIILQFSETSRMDVSQTFEPVYQVSFYRNFFTQFMVAGKMDHNWTRLGFTAPSVLALFVLFGKRNQYRALKVSFLILTGMLWLPFFGNAMNGFAYVSNRWCFIYAGLICYILVTVWEDMLELKNTSFLLVIFLSVIYCFVLFYAGKRGTGILYGSLFLASVLLVSVAKGISEKGQSAAFHSKAMLCIVFIHVILNLFVSFSGIAGNKKPDLVEYGTAWKRNAETAPYAVKSIDTGEDGFFRFEMDRSHIMNSASLAKVNGIAYYWSLENAYISKYLKDMAPSVFRVYNYRDLDHRTFLDALASVKYFVQYNSDFLPFGFDYKEKVLIGKKDYHIYENKYVLPLGYTYKNYIPYEDYQKMSPLQRQEAMLQGIVLEQAKETVSTSRSECKPVFTAQSLDYKVICEENVIRQSDGSFKVRKKGAKIRLEFSGRKNCETYLSLEGVDMKADRTRVNQFILRIHSDESNNKLRFNTERHKLYMAQQDFLVNLGYHDEAQSFITISFPRSGTYRFEDMKVICQPMEKYVRQIESLREYELEMEEIGTNTVKGVMNLPEDRILCLSIPYSKGWSARVDGKKADLLKANVMYMALPLEKGEHKIELFYRTPGLNMGLGISGMGIALFGVLAWYHRRKR